MAVEPERRNYTRYDTPRGESAPFSITVNDLSDEAVEPVDFSAGGFRVIVPAEPDLGRVVTCSMRVSDITLEGFQAKVVRVEEAPGGSPGWLAALEVQMSDDERDNFASVLTALLSELIIGS